MSDDSLEIDAFRDTLIRTAAAYARDLSRRPNMVGILLYGSLTTGNVTRFSDVDLALFYSAEPPMPIEHRFVDGCKVDLLELPVAELAGLLDPLPRTLNVGFPLIYVLRSLMWAGDESVLFDPQGEITRVRETLRKRLPMETVRRAALTEGYLTYYRPTLDTTKTLHAEGNDEPALRHANWCANMLNHLATQATGLKDPIQAAECLGLAGFAGLDAELGGIVNAPIEASAAACQAAYDLWKGVESRVLDPIRERNRAAGVVDPDLIELIEPDGLFWPGRRLYEFGRLIGEFDLALEWCRHDLDRGDRRALGRLWSMRGPGEIRQRWEQIAAALMAAGHDADDLILPQLAADAFVLGSERVDRAFAAAEERDLSRAGRAIEIIEEIEQAMLGALHLMTPEELEAWIAERS